MRSACVCPARHAPSLAWDAWAAHAWPAGAAWRGVHAWEGPARGCTGELPKWGGNAVVCLSHAPGSTWDPAAWATEPLGSEASAPRVRCAASPAQGTARDAGVGAACWAVQNTL